MPAPTITTSYSSDLALLPLLRFLVSFPDADAALTVHNARRRGSRTRPGLLAMGAPAIARKSLPIRNASFPLSLGSRAGERVAALLTVQVKTELMAGMGERERLIAPNGSAGLRCTLIGGCEGLLWRPSGQSILSFCDKTKKESHVQFLPEA